MQNRQGSLPPTGRGFFLLCNVDYILFHPNGKMHRPCKAYISPSTLNICTYEENCFATTHLALYEFTWLLELLMSAVSETT